MTHEEWRPVVGYEGYYEVSNMGNVRSVDRIVTTKNGRTLRLKSHILSLDVKPQGYLSVCLFRDGKGRTVYVHRLVAEAFIENPDDLPVVDHINCDTLDARVENLRWVTASENTRHAIKVGNYDVDEHTSCLHSKQAKAKSVEVNGRRVIRDDGEIYPSIVAAARALGYKCAGRVSSQLRGITPHAKGHTFQYLDEQKPHNVTPKARRVVKRDIETGEILTIFDNTADAVRDAGGTSILHCLSGTTKSSAGYIWEYERPGAVA